MIAFWRCLIGLVFLHPVIQAIHRRTDVIPTKLVTEERASAKHAADDFIAGDDLSEWDDAVLMQGNITVHHSARVQTHTWQDIAQEIIVHRFGDNSTASRGLRAILAETASAEVPMTEWRRLAYALASLRLADNKIGPAYAFPARHVAYRPAELQPKHSSKASFEVFPKEPAFESYQSFEAAWNEWTMICIIGLCLIMLASVLSAHQRSQKLGKKSLVHEIETRWRLTGSSALGSLSILRAAADAEDVTTHGASSEALSVWDGTVATFSVLVSTGLLAMPYAFSLAGLIAAPLLLFFVACSVYTANLMFWSMQAEAGRQCVPRGCLFSADLELDWGSLAKAAFGPKAKQAVDIFLIVELWGYVLSITVCASMNFAQLFERLEVSSAIGLSVTMCYSLTFAPRRLLTKLSVMSNMVFIACCVMFIVTGLMLPEKAPPSEIQIIKPHGILAACGILVFSPAGHSVYPQLIQQMEEPSKFPTCLRWAYISASIVYLAVALPGYYLFGNSTQPSAVRNIGVDLHLMPLPNLGWMNTAAALAMVLKLVNQQALVLSPLTAVIKGVLTSRLGPDCDVVKNSVTPTVLLVTAMVASRFANEMALLLNLLGSVFCMNIAFVMPVLCYWRLAPNPLNVFQKVVSVFLVIMGISLGILGVVTSF